MTDFERKRGALPRRTFLGLSIAGGAALIGASQRRIFAAETVDPITAETAYGKVRGASVNGVAMFRGIPYGGPTEGAARFLPPSKPQKWCGVRDATVNGPQCIQGPGNIFLNPPLADYFSGGRRNRLELATSPYSENCLVLNVLTTGLRGKRPVMVYIHGGGFVSGSGVLSLFADRHVREQDVVLVGVNHRLSVFGYTYLGGLSRKYAVGNAGQLDLIAALEWVRDNIANFGGDPGNVTVFGESGGGAKISALMGMPAAKGLFHKAIVESGSMLRFEDREQGTRAAKAMMAKLGLTRVEELQKVPATELFEASSRNVMAPGPVVDGHSIPTQPWEPTAPAMSADIPMIIGNCKDETTIFSLGDQALFHLDESGLRTALMTPGVHGERPGLVLGNSGIPEDKVDEVIARYRRDHPGNTPSDLYFRIEADRGMRQHVTRQAELKLAQGKAKVFIYYFHWSTPVLRGELRAFHTAELPLAMRLTFYPQSEHLSRQISAAWAAFARNGNPSQKGLEWPAYTTARRTTMMFDVAKSEAANNPDHDEWLMLKNMPSGGFL